MRASSLPGAEMQSENPYWDIYSRLVALRTVDDASAARRAILDLAGEAGMDRWQLLKLRALACLPWFRSQMAEEAFFLVLREKYAYSVLSPKILWEIGSYAPIIELGAGNGYNAWLLREMGCEVEAFDAFPVEEGKNWFFETRFGMPTRSGRSFTTIKKGDGSACSAYPGHTLLLCWPPRNPMAVRALADFPGKRIIFIGHKPTCADKAFYKKLAHEWVLEKSMKTGSWDACHVEELEVYRRKND